MTDPIADMLARIKNAHLAKHKEVVLPYSKVKEAIAKILVDNKYMAKFEVIEKKPQSELVLTLGYKGKLPLITGIKRVSKPGRRLYSSVDKVPPSLNGYGITIVSTSKGLLTDKEARQQNVGGELLCQIW
ncbi:MAG: 30S ribosomal protein S8 [Candidatus Pacebacteria bacterium CG10_big_fil_rev_8_21_14_0_10_36_11]|nr:30S ribosomal protein S8 [Candidatus Pacearchaeota archaeon]OIP73689.1 MAG: 30S ribosomal protein S8 [Candidatus Pacebacteria bacterium CG2_30_36_39]PIR64726.1 MAG: 30S ribosomal protein S8 [Candidatus Pacebacteria bacterium CG10_big_fil_rev_8_21_14_0_10_36_11]PJC42845.1 MAG: 30S ribosomal protein S8 [Candidatus Pacebacteria bacterium CG_4_9_14_0_2_um_filter_36_8]